MRCLAKTAVWLCLSAVLTMHISTVIFHGNGIPLYYDYAKLTEMAEIYAPSRIACAAACSQSGCSSILFQENDGNDDRCYTTEDHYGYMGNLNVTEYGVPCQRWDAQTPHEHNYTAPDQISEGNYCRAFDWDKCAWCYTTDPTLIWDCCATFKCFSEGKNCRLYNSTANPHAVVDNIGFYSLEPEP